MSFWSFFKNFKSFRNSIAIDLGTANTLIWKDGQIVVNEPTIVAFEKNTERIIACGQDAKTMLGRTSGNKEIIEPMKGGVVAKPYVVADMLKIHINEISSIKPYNMLVCCPCGASESEQINIREACEKAEAKNIDLLFEPMASAIAINKESVLGSQAIMIVDIGGGTTEVAVISLGEIVSHESIKVAGNYFTQAIIDYCMQEKKVSIGVNDAERIKHIAGSAYYVDDKFEKSKVQGYGNSIVEGRPIEISLPNIEIRNNILDKPIQEIIKAIKETLKKTSPELSEDIFKNGLWLTGGGALLKGLDEKIREEIKLSVNIHTEVNPLHTVITGAGTVLDNIERYRNVLIKRKPMT